MQHGKLNDERQEMLEVKVTMKDGETHELNPVINITIDNGYHEYDFKPEDIEKIELYEVADEPR